MCRPHKSINRPIFLACILCVVIMPCRIESASVTEVEQDKVLQLSHKFEQNFLHGNNTKELYQMRDVFFPSSKYRYWQADGIEIIDADVCLNIQTISTHFSCRDWQRQSQDQNDSIDEKNSITHCLVFRWTNSYLLNLIDVHQLYQFDPVTTGALFGTIAHSHLRRKFHVSLNVSCDSLFSSMSRHMVQQSLAQFLSWSKAYARSQGRPDKFNGVDQGYVTRKYDYASVNLLLFDEQSQQTYYSTLTCFFLLNVLILYLVVRNTPTIYKKLSKAANQTDDYERSIIKSLIILVSTVIAPAYICGMTVVHLCWSTFVPVCENDTYYHCIPQMDFPRIHREQVISLASKTVIVLSFIPLYLIATAYTVKTSAARGILFQNHFRCLEIYFLWCVLIGIHIGTGLASIPLTIFAILIPTYVVFYLSAWIIGLTLFLLPIAAIFYACDRAKCHETNLFLLLRGFEFLFIYLLTMGTLVIVVMLYYFFLAGGASMNSAKGVLFSLLPPMLISIAAFVMKRKLFAKQNLTIDLAEKVPLLNTQQTHYS